MRAITVAAVAVASAALLGATAEPAREAATTDMPRGRLVLGLHPPERIAVLDVATGAIRERRLPGGTLCHGPLTVSGDRVFFLGSRRGRSALMSLDLTLERGPRVVSRSRRAHMPEGSAPPRAARLPRGWSFSPSGGSLSPGGSLLAVAAHRERRPFRTRIALVRAADGAVDLLPAPLPATRGELAWSRTGEWLYVAARDRRIAVYRPRDRRVVTLPVRLADDVIELSAAR